MVYSIINQLPIQLFNCLYSHSQFSIANFFLPLHVRA
jgi:hypothetical protein